MRSIGTSSKLVVPSVWSDLLAGMVKQDAPECPVNGVDINDPRAYKNDSRSVSIQMEEFEVFANLKSSDEKYWIEWEVWEEHFLIFPNDGLDPEDKDYEIPDEVNLHVREYDLLFQFRVTFY